MKIYRSECCNAQVQTGYKVCTVGGSDTELEFDGVADDIQIQAAIDKFQGGTYPICTTCGEECNIRLEFKLEKDNWREYFRRRSI